MNMIGTWIAAGLTIAILSFLYKDNPLYKFAEYLYVGVSAGYWVIYIWAFDVKPMLLDEFFRQVGTEKWILVIPALFGVMMLTRWVPRAAWISRWPISFTVGIAAGLALTAQVQGYIIPQLQATLLPLVSFGEDAYATIGHSINNILLFVGVVCSILFFYFSDDRLRCFFRVHGHGPYLPAYRKAHIPSAGNRNTVNRRRLVFGTGHKKAG
jgi:hypothetical protein